MDLRTPYYLIDKGALLRNLRTIEYIRAHSGAKLLLALKCFATWSVFDLMRAYLDGTTSSSLYETRLGRLKFGGETHAYSVAWADHEIDEALAHCDKIIFNSIAQLERFAARSPATPRGLRLNPGVSRSGFDLADPCRPHSRLGEADVARVEAVLDRISGVMIHNNCENADFDAFARMLDQIERKYANVLARIDWISLGGGIHFSADGYPLDAFCERLRHFARRHGVQVYLEPGEAAVTRSTTLEVTVLDVGFHGKPFVVVDSSIEAHMLDLLVYRQSAQIAPDAGAHRYLVCGKSCLAGDVFGESRFEQELRPGDRISIQDAAGYTMVKKNWFNGLTMPSIALREPDGRITRVREFSFEDYLASLS